MKYEKIGNKCFFDAIIKKDDFFDAAYVDIPMDVLSEFDKSRMKVKATFDYVIYCGQIVRMGTSNRIIGIRKNIKNQINKQAGDIIKITIKEVQK